MQRLIAVCFVVLLASAVPVESQNRLGGDPQGGQSGGNQTAQQNATGDPEPYVIPEGFADDVLVVVTDNVLYGFTKDEVRNKRLGNEFSVYIAPINGTIDYTILLDEMPLELGNGDIKARATGPAEEKFKFPNLRAVNLVVELHRGEEVEEVDFGLIRLRPMTSLAKEVEEDIEDKLAEQIRQFNPSEWTLYNLKWGVVGLASVVGGLYAGFHRGKEEEENEQPYTIAF